MPGSSLSPKISLPSYTAIVLPYRLIQLYSHPYTHTSWNLRHVSHIPDRSSSRVFSSNPASPAHSNATRINLGLQRGYLSLFQRRSVGIKTPKFLRLFPR